MASKRLNLTIDEKVLDRLNEYCEDNGRSRSSFIAEAVLKLIEAEQAMKTYGPVLEQFNKLSAEFDRLQKEVAEKNK